MPNNLYISLNFRGVLSVEGGDARQFLQGIISNDINKVDKHKAIYALMLTPQGKFLYDFFICEIEGKIVIDCNKALLPTIMKKLNMYKLRSDVSLSDISDKYEVVALIGDGVFKAVEHNEEGDVKSFCKGVAYIDPRSRALYARSVIERENNYQSFKAYEFSAGSCDDYDRQRINALVPSGDVDMQQEKSFPHDFNMNDLNAIDYNKGCYVGQEVTARVHHRGNVRKRICMVQGKSDLPELGDEIKIGDRKAGTLLSSLGDQGLAILNLEELEKNKNGYKVGAIELTVVKK